MELIKRLNAIVDGRNTDDHYSDDDLDTIDDAAEHIAELESWIDAYCAQPDQTKVINHFLSIQASLEAVKECPRHITWLPDPDHPSGGRWIKIIHIDDVLKALGDK